ncbi:hypothetical protein O6R08_10955 [Cutibacterium equinum]|uniref:Uncharacterized protein n=1 Tax=Cutibacterium equinum TaxID=3016342 RepID=A0ABY7QY33_9ACTN|nr:hypothetical protein [Cutibacterium equinum]WCC79945.1 hypothetical protein O6R08_10955 [Cutibacterium equinum]
MATGSEGTPGKGSSSSKYSSVIAVFIILFFIMKKDGAFNAIFGLALFGIVVMWIVQAQKDKKKQRPTGWDYGHESDTDDHERPILSPDSSEQKDAIEQRPSPSAQTADTLSDLSDDRSLSDHFSALTAALSGNFDGSEEHGESVHPDHTRAMPALTNSQPSAPTTSDPDQDVPKSVGTYGYEPLPSDIAAPRFDAEGLPVPETSSTPLVQTSQPSAPPMTPAIQRKSSSATGTKPPSSSSRAKIVGDHRFGDILCGSAAISLTHESSTMRPHDASENYGSGLWTSSLFSQD